MKKTQVNKKSILCIGGLLVISCLFVFKNFLFGNQILAYTDIGSDTYDQYLMHYQGIINHIRDGNFSLWDFTNGYGVNMFTYNLFDPFLLLLYLFGVLFGAEQIYGILVYWEILHILLAGITIYLFLSCFELSERAKVMASYLYALCGYMVVWGQHYQFGTVIVLFPLLLMAVEYSFKKNKWFLGITVFCTIASFCSLYMAYMQFVMLGFYVLFRVAWNEKLFSLDGIKQVGKTYGAMVLGIGIGCIQLIPSAFLILNVSGRVSGDSLISRCISMLAPYPGAYYKTLWKHLFSSNLEGVNTYSGYTNFYEDTNVFLSALLIIAAVQFIYLFFTEHYSKKQRFVLVLAGIAIGFMLLIPLGSMIFNGFAYPFSRHTFLCMPIAVWLIAYVLNKMLEENKYSIPLLVISVVVIVGYYVRLYLSTAHKGAFLLGIFAAGIGLALIGYCFIKHDKIRKLCPMLLLVCLIFTMSGDAYMAYNYTRHTVTKDSDYLADLYDEDVKEALAYIDSIDDSFYRVEKTYTTGTEISCLNSMAQNYRGISTYNSTLNTNVTTWLNQFWPGTAVINAAHRSFANASGESVPASLSNVKYVLSDNAEFATEGYVLLKQFGDVYVYENTYTKDIGKFFAGREITGEETESMILLPEEGQMDMSALSEGISFNEPEKDSLVTGTAAVSEAGVLMIAIPYEDGWSAYVDGEKVEIYKVNYGFCGIELDAGEHEIEFRFDCPGFKMGVAASLISLAITIAIWCIVPYCKRKNFPNS